MFLSVSLRVKLLFPVILFAIALFVAGQLVITLKAIEIHRTQQTQQMEGVAQSIVDHYINSSKLLSKKMLLSTPQWEELQQWLALIGGVEKVALYDRNNQLIDKYQAINVPTSIQRWSLLIVNRLTEEVDVSIPVALNAGNVTVTVTASQKGNILIVQNAMMQIFAFVLLMFCIGLILSVSLKRRVFKPMAYLSSVMPQLTNRNMRRPLDYRGGNNELGSLYDSFNQMLQRYEAKQAQADYSLKKMGAERDFANHIMETVRFATLSVDMQGIVRYYNPQAEGLLHITNQGGESLSISQVTKNKLTFENIKLAVTSPVHIMLESGPRLRVRSTELNDLQQYLVCLENITEVEQASERSRIASSVFENSLEAIMIVDESHRIKMVNPAFHKMLQIPSYDLLNNEPKQVFRGTQVGHYIDIISKSVDQYGFWQGEINEQRPNGSELPLFVKVTKICKPHDERSFEYFYTFSDMSQLKEMERLDYLAHHDSLTGLANRSKLQHFVSRMAQTKANVSDGKIVVLYIDLDGFKSVNDTFGHDAGDFVLKQVANRMQRLIKEGDCVARLAGDEFVIVLGDLQPARIETLVMKLTDSVREPMVFHQQTLSVGCSVGVAFSDGQNIDFDQLLKQADTQMYRAKQSNKRERSLLS